MYCLVLVHCNRFEKVFEASGIMIIGHEKDVVTVNWKK